MLVLGLLVADGTFELRLHAAFESHVPVERVRSRVGITATWTIVIAITRGYLVAVDFRQRLAAVLDFLDGDVIGANARFTLDRRRARCRLLRQLILRHQPQIHRLVLIVPFDGVTWRVLPF